MELALNDFKEFYRENREKIHLKFCRPLVEASFKNSHLDDILIFYSRLIGFINNNKPSKELIPGITSELTDILFSEMLPFEDIVTYSKEQILTIEGIPNGKMALRQSLNSVYTDNHFKLLAYGVIINHPVSNNNFCVMLHVTNSMWAIFINSMIEIIRDNSKIIVVYKPEMPAYLYYFYTESGIEMRAEMVGNNDFRIYFFPALTLD